MVLNRDVTFPSEGIKMQLPNTRAFISNNDFGVGTLCVAERYIIYRKLFYFLLFYFLKLYLNNKKKAISFGNKITDSASASSIHASPCTPYQPISAHSRTNVST